MGTLLALPALTSCGSASAQAAVLNYLVTIDSGALIGQTQPFGFEATLTDDNFIANDNTVNLSGFDFNDGGTTTTGSASGAPTLQGGASGNTTSGFNLLQNQGDVQLQSRLTQRFNAGDLLSFNLRLNTSTGSTANGTDRFAFYLFNSAGTRLTTFDPNSGQAQSGQFNPLFTIDFTTPSSPIIREFRANSSGGIVTVDVTPVPEPATWALMMLGLAALCGIGRKRRLQAGASLKAVA